MVRTRILVATALVGLLVGPLAAPTLAHATPVSPGGGEPVDPDAGSPVAPSTATGPLTTALSPATAGPSAVGPTGTPTAPPTDDTVTRIRVAENGSARWTVEIRTRLRTDADVENFRAFQREFEANTSRYLDSFADRMAGVVEDAANATGRAMEATDFAAETSIQEVPRRWGVVAFSFRWSAFAAADGESLVVGDVFEGGFFLAANDSLVVSGPDGYEVAGATPRPTSTVEAAVTWEGRRDFADGRPRVRFDPAGSTDGPPAGESSGLPLPLAVGGLVVAVAGGWLYRRRLGAADGSMGPAGGDAGTGGGDGPAAGGGDDSGDGAAGEDPPVMTDAERVAALVADNGGRMRQAEVVEAMDWSASKTSRVLADMAEDGRIEKLRVGRENVVELVD